MMTRRSQTSDVRLADVVKYVLVATVLLVAISVGVPALLAAPADLPDLLAHYPVPGNPQAISAEAVNRIWFTLPEQNLIGRLVVTSTVDFDVQTYAVPTSNSYPYDLKFAGGYVWFTEQQGNKIARLNPATGGVQEFLVPTPNSQPTGIDVLPGTPTQVWFTERAGDKLGKLTYTNSTTFTMQEYPLPATYAGAQMQDVDAFNADSIWFTAPGVNRLGYFRPSLFGGYLNPFEMKLVPDDGEPWSVAVSQAGTVVVWVTDRAGNRVGGYYPQTISNFIWLSLPTADSAPSGLALSGDLVWATEAQGERVAQVHPRSSARQEFGVRTGELAGIDVDAGGHVWFAERDARSIGELRPPYFRSVHLPLIMR